MKMEDILRRFKTCAAGEAVPSALQDDASCFLDMTRRAVATGKPLWEGKPPPPLLSEDTFDRTTLPCWGGDENSPNYYTATTCLAKWTTTEICGVFILEQRGFCAAAVLLWSNHNELDVYVPFASLAVLEADWMDVWAANENAADALQDFTTEPHRYRERQVSLALRAGAANTPKALLNATPVCACRYSSVPLVAAAREVRTPSDVALAREAVKSMLRFFPIGASLECALDSVSDMEVRISFDAGVSARAEGPVPLTERAKQKKQIGDLIGRPVLHDLAAVLLCKMAVPAQKSNNALTRLGLATAFEMNEAWMAVATSVKAQERAVRRSALESEKRSARLTLHREGKDVPVLDSLLFWQDGKFGTRTRVVPETEREPREVCRLLLRSMLCADPSDDLVDAAAETMASEDGFAGGAFQAHSAVARSLPAWAALLLVEEGPEGRLGPIFLEGPSLQRREVCLDSARRALLLPWVCALVVHGHETSRVSVRPIESLAYQPLASDTASKKNSCKDEAALRLSRVEGDVAQLRKRLRVVEGRAVVS